MKTALAIILALAVVLPASAKPGRAATAIPRALGRTAKNMVTFKDRSAAVDEWATLGAFMLEGQFASRAIADNPHTREIYPLFPGRPRGATVNLSMLATAFLYDGLEQYGHELCNGLKATDPKGCQGLEHLPAAATIAGSMIADYRYASWGK